MCICIVVVVVSRKKRKSHVAAGRVDLIGWTGHQISVRQQAWR